MYQAAYSKSDLFFYIHIEMPGYCIPELRLNMQEKLWGVALGVT